MTRMSHAEQHRILQRTRIKDINRMRPHLPAALETLQRCLAAPCDPTEYKRAREMVHRWLGYERACESHNIAVTAERKRSVRVVQ